MSKVEEVVWSTGDDLFVSPNMFGEILSESSDIVIAIDRNGIVQNVLTNSVNQTFGCLDHWVGRNIKSFLTEECHPKIDSILAAVKRGDLAKPRITELNHVDNASWQFPIRYSVIDSGEDGPILMVGRDLGPVAEIQNQLVKAQSALEKDYEIYREFDTRYRVLMGATRDALAFVDAKTGRIEDLNGAGAAMLGAEAEILVGGAFFQEFEDRRRAEFLDSLNGAAASKVSVPIVVRTRRGHAALKIHPSVFRAGGRLVLLCRMEADEQAEPITEELGINLHALFNNGMDAVVFTDARGDIRSANDSFLNLCDIANASGLAGKSLADFLVRGTVDLKIIMDSAARSGRVRQFVTKLETAFGSHRPVEISATYLSDRANPAIGFVIRDMARAEAANSPSAPGTGDAAGNVAELVGASPLKDIVAATTDVIEKICIETAVALTRNNRVAAAEMLGLSRQSLYVKLRKYNLINKTSEE